MTVIVRNHEAEHDEIWTNIDRMTETPTEIILHKGGFVKKFDKDIYSLQRKDG